MKGKNLSNQNKDKISQKDEFKDQPQVEKNNSNTTKKEEDKDPTKYGDWQVDGRAIDF